MNNENKKEPSKEIIEEEYRLGKEYYNKLLKKLPEECLRFSIYNNGKMNKNNLLSNNLKGKEGYEFNNNTYLLIIITIWYNKIKESKEMNKSKWKKIKVKML